MAKILDLNLSPETNINITWMGNATVGIKSGSRGIVIDPYVHPKTEGYQYVFCTHEHYDHAYPETVKYLVETNSFKKLIIPRSCLYPSTRFFSRQLAFLEPEQYEILTPKYYDRESTRVGSTEYVGHSRSWSDLDGSIFSGPNNFCEDDWDVDAFEMVGEDPEVPFPVEGLMPQLAYFVRDLSSGITFYHFGDNHWTYSDMEKIKGKLDIMLLPIGKMGLEEDEKAIKYMSPKIIIPIHWRDSVEDYPIPKNYETYEPPDQAIRGYHLPHPGDPPYPGQAESPYAYIKELDPIAKRNGSRLVQIRAGETYDIR